MLLFSPSESQKTENSLILGKSLNVSKPVSHLHIVFDSNICIIESYKDKIELYEGTY